MLLHRTLQFHVRNWLGRAYNQRTRFSVNLRIHGGRPIALALRPFAGDLFVLYEVLAFNSYYIDSDCRDQYTTTVHCNGASSCSLINDEPY